MNKSRVVETFRRTVLTAALAAGCAVSLQGCVLGLLGVAGGGAMVATDRRTLGAQTEDREIQVKALAQLHSGLPEESHVNVNVYNRRALITGEVPSDTAKQSATQIVGALTNLNGIANELVVGPASSFTDRTNDSYLVGRVKSAMIGTNGISSNTFKVVCERNVIYLMGLETRQEGDIAANIAASVPGVAKVVKLYQYITPDSVAGDDGKPSVLASPSPAAGSPAPGAAAAAPIVDSATVGSEPIDSSGVTATPIK